MTTRETVRYAAEMAGIVREKPLNANGRRVLPDEDDTPPAKLLTVHAAEEEREAIEAVPVETIVDGLLVRGAITECAARVKAGKTSFMLEMLKSITQGEEFLGLDTTPVNVLVLTEERPATFRAALRRHSVGAGVSIVYRHECFGMQWPDIADQAVQWCLLNAVDALVVDTLSSWAMIPDENDATAAMAAMHPLEQAAAVNLAVWYNRHDRKGGGELGESGRGSSAFAGVSDILLQLKRADSEGHQNRRILSGIGRFNNVPEQLVLELTEAGYRNLGNALAVEQAKVEAWLRDHLPAAEAPATMEQLMTGIGPTASKSTLDRVLKRLVDTGVAKKADRGFGKNGKAAGYWRASE